MDQLLTVVYAAVPGGPCPDHSFRCPNGRCISSSNVCDAVCDCGKTCDDEKVCGKNIKQQKLINIVDDQQTGDLLKRTFQETIPNVTGP